MNILYDHQIFSYQRFGGISRYFYELLYNLSIYSKINKLTNFEVKIKLATRYSHNDYLKGAKFFKPRIWEQSSSSNVLNSIRLFSYFLLNKRLSKYALLEQDFDVFHPTFYDPYFLRYIGNKPYVITIVDMIPERYPDFFCLHSFYGMLITSKWIKAKRELCQKASKIIAISENTKKDIVNFYNIDPRRIQVIYLAHSTPKEIHNVKVPHRDYFLFVGDRGGYKNFIFFIKAVASLIKKYNYSIVCIGGGNFTKDEKQLFSFLQIADSIHQYSVSDLELYSFYKNALALIYPSAYEGFGLPILEAFSMRCPVILSNASCFPEIAQQGGVYFELNNPEELEHAVNKVVSNSSFRQDLIESGLKRCSDFSWQTVAEETVELYSKLI